MTPSPRNLLVRGVNWLGDAVMTTPALRRLRERFPAAHITLLTLEKLQELWLHHPDLDEVITFRAGQGVLSVAMKLRKPMVLAGLREGLRAYREVAGGLPRNDESLRMAAQRVRRIGFDLALVLPNSPRSALEAWLARIPQRVGYARPWRNRLLTQAVPPRPDRIEMRKRTPQEIRSLVAGAVVSPPTRNPRAHQLHDYLHLVGALGANPEVAPPLLHVTTAEIAAVCRRLDIIADPAAPPLIGLNAGAEYGPAKRWPVGSFAAAVKAVQQQVPCRWLIFGGPRDLSLAGELEARLRHPVSGIQLPSFTNVAGQTSLRELMALLKLCDVVLTNDTGPMHLAAALGTPVVVPFGSTAPELTGPGLPGDARHRLLRSSAVCAPCCLRECPIDFRCLLGIAPEQAAHAVLGCLGLRERRG